MVFEAATIGGVGRGKKMGIPTVNLSLDDVPTELTEGIYACFATVNGARHTAALHYGPRPVFNDSLSCEAHLLDTKLESLPERMTIEIIQRLRDVQNFPSTEAMITQIEDDIKQARAILVG